MDRAWQPLFEDADELDHVALVYRDPGFLARAVAHWSAPPLRKAGGAILVGTPAHMQAIRGDLRKLGVDVDGAERSGRLVFIDADWLMGHFILDGTPDATRFRALATEIIGGVRRAIGAGPGIRAWGEMVSLLRLRGDPAGARRLEALWKDAIAESRIALLCSYDMQGLPKGASAMVDEDVRHMHDTLVVQPEGAAMASEV